ncbi:MAG: hypothetical protein IT342_22660 [Candidatus Melainabacteria bacterium]|nr:hypothetical protein [Candidatus Melainabacteria bacterium]
MTLVQIRPQELMDGAAVWSVIEPIIQGVETDTLASDMAPAAFRTNLPRNLVQELI